jgi:hypothetical protein
MTQSEAFESGLARTNDSTVLRGKFYISGSALPAATPTQILTFNAQGMGARSAALATVFSRYRYKYIRMKFLQSVTTTTPVAIGVYDEGSPSEGEAPVTLGDVLEMRCSGSAFPGQTVPNFISWQPVDKKLWYYTVGGASGSDSRLFTAGVLFAAAAGAGAINVEVDYCIVFQGAVDTGAN